MSNGHRSQQKKSSQEKDSNTLVTVLLDEIGLADQSPFLPLKVLHKVLENPQVSVVGISNWKLDPAKMNRAVISFVDWEIIGF